MCSLVRILVCDVYEYVLVLAGKGDEDDKYEEGTIGVSELERIVSLRNTESGVVAKTPNKYKVESAWFFWNFKQYSYDVQ